MLKRFEVKNYRTFKNKIEIDFSNVGGYRFNQDCINDNTITKMLIYGKNATGKTNLGRALMDLWALINGDLKPNKYSGYMINADSTDDYSSFKYLFVFDNHELIYTYKRASEDAIINEELKLDNKTAFKNDFKEVNVNYKILSDLGVTAGSIEKYLFNISNITENNKIPFLRWIINNTSYGRFSLLGKLDTYLQSMKLINVSMQMWDYNPRYNEAFFEMLGKKDHLKDFEEFLNVMGISCKLQMIPLPDGTKQLYFVHKKPVPFYETASSGTRSLTNLYKKVIAFSESSFLYLDEFDAFYHYEMAEKLVIFFKNKYPNTQMILTTHNTNLMTNKLMRPDTLFILSETGKLTALCDATKREIREGHNLEKMYISGEFDKYE